MTTKNGFDLVSFVMAYEGGELDQDAMVAGFQAMIDDGVVWQLQGHYGRTAMALIEQGLCIRPLGRGDQGELEINQGLRDCYVVSVNGDRALVEYTMPAGRTFYLDVPRHKSFDELRELPWYGERGADGKWHREIRPVSAKKPPARWRNFNFR